LTGADTDGPATRANYHTNMIETARVVPVTELAEALGRAAIRSVRVPEPAATIRGVVMHAPGDPVPSQDLLVLCATPADFLPDCVAVVVREAEVAATLVDAAARTAVFAAPDAARWSDVYDRVHLAVGESFGQLAEHDAFHLADAIAVATGGAVAIEDARRRVVAFSTVPGQRIDDVRRQGILGRQVPEHVEREKWYARLWHNAGVSEFADGTESTGRLAIAVRAGAEPLGSIWVVGTRDALNPGADEILARSVDAVAACLAYQDHFAARGRGARRQLLRRVLGLATDGPDPPSPMSLPSPPPSTSGCTRCYRRTIAPGSSPNCAASSTGWDPRPAGSPSARYCTRSKRSREQDGKSTGCWLCATAGVRTGWRSAMSATRRTHFAWPSWLRPSVVWTLCARGR
jgi:hypothetical protein